ncbi:MAG: hypothetical protein AMXMBFR64_27330 [Myxococcales bacterium]
MPQEFYPLLRLERQGDLDACVSMRCIAGRVCPTRVPGVLTEIRPIGGIR